MSKKSSTTNNKGAPPLPDDADVVVLPPLPPDGGYGWVVMISAMFCSLIIDGVCFSFGVFFTELLDRFGESKAKTSWVGSLVPGMYLGMGPIASALSNKYGFRPVTMVGGFIATFFYFIATYSPNISWLIFLYGFCGGFGLGLAYLPSIGAVSFYFEKKRALATGIAVCGTGIGGFVFAPLSKFLLAEYGFQGAYWIISGIVFNLVVCGALFRPLKARVIRKKKKNATNSVIMQHIIEDKRNRTISTGSLDGAVITRENKIEKGQAANVELQPIVEQDGDVERAARSRSASLHYFGSAVQIAAGSKTDLEERVKTEVARPMYKQDIFYTGSVTNITEYKEQPNREEYIRSHTSLPQIDENEKQSCGAKCAPAIHVIKEMFDVSLLKSFMFQVVCVSSFLAMFGFFTPFFFISTYALSVGLSDDQATWLLMLLSLFNTISRVGTGFISDRPWANPLIIHNGALIGAGVATCLLPFLRSFPLLVIYCGVFGMCIAAYICLRSIVLVDLLGLEKLNNAFGLFLFFQGIASIIGSPVAGALYDYTQSFATSFMVGGFFIAMAGVITIPVRFIKRWEEKRDAKKGIAHHRYSEVKMQD